MNVIISIREKIQEVYADHTLILMKGLQLIVALFIFYIINKNVGYLEIASTNVVTVGLAVICTFLPMVMTMFVATGLVLAHMYGVSLGYLAATALLFLIMYVIYFRFTPKMTLFAVLTPIACVFHVPFALTMIVALIYPPIAVLSLGCGVVAYYMLEYVKQNSATAIAEGAPSILEQMSTYVKEVLNNKEMWVLVLAMIIATLFIYTIRRQSFHQAWKIAIVIGTIVNVVCNVAGDITLGVECNYTNIVVGSVIAVVIGLILEIFYFNVDYSRTERVQYEDDDYYYYVKAVPKLKVVKPQKNVKQIYSNEEDDEDEVDEEEFEEEELAPQTPKPQRRKTEFKRGGHSRVSTNKKSAADVDRELLEKSMRNL